MTALVGLEYGGAKAAAIHQNRLVLIGSGAVGDLVLASGIDSWTDFATTRLVDGAQVATDADGFFFQQVSSRQNEFHAVAQQEGLFLFGSIGESTTPAGAFTAAATVIRENSWYGSERGRTPVIAGGLVVFIQQGASDVRGIRWTEAERKYESASLRAMTGDVFRKAVDMTWGRSRFSQADSVYVVDEDGTIGVCSIRAEQPQVAWSIWKMPGGEALGGANVVGREMLLIDRDGALQLEAPDISARPGEALLDAGVILTPETTPQAVPEHLRGTLRVAWREDPDMPEQQAEVILEPGHDWTVALENGQPVFSYTEGLATASVRLYPIPSARLPNEPLAFMMVPADTPIRIGFPYLAEFETLPFLARTQSGTRRGVTRSRIFGAYIDVVGMRPNELLVNDRQKSPTPYRQRSGEESWRIGGTLGWRKRTTLKFGLQAQTRIAGLYYRAKG